VRTALRELRLALGLHQRAFAARLGVSVGSLRMWDSGVRIVPGPILTKAKAELARQTHEQELLPFRCLPMSSRYISRPSNELFGMVVCRQRYRRDRPLAVRFSRPLAPRSRLSSRIIPGLRTQALSGCRSFRQCRMISTFSFELCASARAYQQEELATRIGAARKAVVYQWESRKRKPSPVFWERVQRLVQTEA
jgi:DNA-binding transcriptional regulator YiaG